MKMSLSRALLLAGVAAAAGMAQAQTYDAPQEAGEASTMTQGAPNQLTDNPNTLTTPTTEATVDTTVLGAAPATVTTYTYTSPVTTYVVPAPITYSYVAPRW